jgi:copper resistance protein B
MNRCGTNPRRLVPFAIVLCTGAAQAQDNMDNSTGETGTEMDMGSMQGGSPPPDARDPHAYSEGVGFTRGGGRPRFADEQSFRSIMIDNLEVSRVEGETVLPYDIEAWFGRTYDRAVLKAEGELEGGDLADARTELLWGHAIAAYWDTQVGVRYDSGAGPYRTWLAAGIEGLAPYRFDLEVTAYVGESSRTALRLDASYDMLINQRLIFQPRLEANFYGKDDVERGLGSGLADVSLGLRLRYEIRRELAPYIGVEWVNQYGGTEDLTRAAGGDSNDTRLTMGLRFWF